MLLPEGIESAEELFEEADVNGDGLVSAKEFFFVFFNMLAAEPEPEPFFQAYDLNEWVQSVVVCCYLSHVAGLPQVHIGSPVWITHLSFLLHRNGFIEFSEFKGLLGPMGALQVLHKRCGAFALAAVHP